MKKPSKALSPATRRSIKRGLKQSAAGESLYLGSFANPIKDATALRERINKILLGYTTVLKRRDGWVDIITVRNATGDILDLLAETNSNPTLRRIAAKEAGSFTRL